MKTAIFDIDGTLADCKWRQHYVLGEKKDWDSFFKLSIKDKSIDPIKRIHQALTDTNMAIVYVTARPERVRDVTEKWLENNIQCTSSAWPLYMRRDLEHRPDYVTKEEILLQLKSEGRQVIMAFDDRKPIIDMYRRHGVMAFSHTDEDFNP